MLKKPGSLAQSQIALLDKVYQEFQNFYNLEFPSLKSRIPYKNTARNSSLVFYRLAQLFFALFTLKALRSPAPYAKAFARFPALRLKSCRKTFANAIATALLGQRSGFKTKNRSPSGCEATSGCEAKKSWSLVLQPLPSFRIPQREFLKLEFLKLKFLKENSLNQNSLR